MDRHVNQALDSGPNASGQISLLLPPVRRRLRDALSTPSERVERSVAAVVVTYQCDGSVGVGLEATLAQVDHVYIVDNGSADPSITLLRNVTSAQPGRITLILNETNLGIATALNQGAEAALAAGYAWLLTLDQDSVIGGGMVREMLATLAASPRADRIGLIAPNTVNAYSGTPLEIVTADGRNAVLHKRRAPHTAIPVALVLTSGNLVRLALFREGIRYRDGFFMDCVDFDFCLRLARIGIDVVLAPDAVMRHTIGTEKVIRVLGKPVHYGDHSTKRVYYMYRNAVRLYLETRSAVLLRSFGRTLLAKVIVSGVFDPVPRSARWAMLRGIAHGIVGRLGP